MFSGCPLSGPNPAQARRFRGRRLQDHRRSLGFRFADVIGAEPHRCGQRIGVNGQFISDGSSSPVAPAAMMSISSAPKLDGGDEEMSSTDLVYVAFLHQRMQDLGSAPADAADHGRSTVCCNRRRRCHRGAGGRSAACVLVAQHGSRGGRGNVVSALMPPLPGAEADHWCRHRYHQRRLVRLPYHLDALSAPNHGWPSRGIAAILLRSMSNRR